MFLILLAGASTAFAQRPDGISYYVNVLRNNGVEFDSCFVFGNDGVLTLLPSGIELAFDQEDHGESQAFWQAVTIFHPVFNIAFSGMATGNDMNGMLKGDGISSFGVTFTFEGYPADCGASLFSRLEDSGSPWLGRD